MAKVLKPFLFVKTAVSWGVDADEAYDRLYNNVDGELADEEDWVLDEVQSDDEAWIKLLMGAEIDEN